MSELMINILYVQTGRDASGNTETTSHAVAPQPGETVDELVRRALGHDFGEGGQFVQGFMPDPGARLELRVAAGK